MLIIAIDPGASGGIAMLNTRKSESPVVVKMPGTPKDLVELLRGMTHMNPLCRAVIEKVGMHRQGNNASASCKFARHCGHVEMALICLGIPFDEVTPQRWMKSMGALPKDKSKRKRSIKDRMQRLYPEVNVALWSADALAILHYALQQERTKNEHAER